MKASIPYLKAYTVNPVLKFQPCHKCRLWNVLHQPTEHFYYKPIKHTIKTFWFVLQRQLLRCMETTDLPESEMFNILGVICPRTGHEISMSQALDDGVLDFKRGKTWLQRESSMKIRFGHCFMCLAWLSFDCLCDRQRIAAPNICKSDQTWASALGWASCLLEVGSYLG